MPGHEFWWPVRVYHEDTDSGGIVYYANYLRFLERARTEWLRGLGCEQAALRRRHGLMFVVVSINLEFKTPARLDERLKVGVKITDCRRASVRLAQSIVRGEAALVCGGEVRIACVDTETLHPRPIPLRVYSELARDR